MSEEKASAEHADEIRADVEYDCGCKVSSSNIPYRCLTHGSPIRACVIPDARLDGEVSATQPQISIGEQINAWIEGEQRALSGDAPDSRCAAHHRGAIKAYQSVLRLLSDTTT